VAARQRGERLGGHVRAEHDHVVAGGAQEPGEHPQRDDMVLARRGGEQDAVAGTPPLDAARFLLQREHTHRDLGREVLVGDGDLAPFPEIAHEPQRGRDDLLADRLRGQLGRDRVPDHEVGGDLVAFQHGGGEGAGEPRDVLFTSGIDHRVNAPLAIAPSSIPLLAAGR
jgi:hypothetical protein